MLSPDFRCKENDGTIWFPSVPVQPGIVTSDYDFHEVGVTICGVPYGYDPDTKFFRHFPYNENDYEI